MAQTNYLVTKITEKNFKHFKYSLVVNFKNIYD